MGHSRGGKAALVAMVDDPRFAIGYICSSGAGGADLYRRNYGETMGNLAGDRRNSTGSPATSCDMPRWAIPPTRCRWIATNSSPWSRRVPSSSAAAR